MSLPESFIKHIEMIGVQPLRDGSNSIPIFGLGTFRAEGDQCYASCLAALRCGYRLIDTAALYENEDQVGAAIQQFLSEETAVTRSDLFVVTKLHWDSHGAATALQRVNDSLQRLKLEYVDLFLIHSPKGGSVVETYTALLEVKKTGKIRSLGVSNFGVHHLEGLAALGLETPVVNQIEMHLWNHQSEVVSYCKARGIIVMAYCPLARGQQFGKTGLAELAQELQVSEASLCNYWCMKNGIVTIPKSTTPGRVEENLRLAVGLKLTASQAAALERFNLNFECSLAVQAQRIPWDAVK